jgi:hypothetical protein
MKKALSASVLFNLVLMACLFALLKQPASDAPNTEAPVEAVIASNEAAASTPKAAEALGEQPVPAEFPQSTTIPLRSRSQERPAVLPLVFQEIDLGQLNLNPDQLQAIDDLRQRFLDEIGGLHQDPKDPAYGERWKRSQPQIDDDLRGMIGVAAFQNYQIEAATVAEKSR